MKFGDQPEGLFVTLPDDPTKRKALFGMAAKWPRSPKDVKQKYIYWGMNPEEWNPDMSEPGFMGNTD